jgi:hypothetical protein
MRPLAGILAASAIVLTSFVGCDLDLQPYVEQEDGGRATDPGDGGGAGPKDAGTGEGGGDQRDAQPNELSDAGDGGTTGSLRKRVFVTSTVTTGAIATGLLGGNAVQAANQRCQQLANQANLGGTFVAWLSVAGSSAYDRLQDTGPWYLVDRQSLVFANKAVIVTVGPNVPIERDETGKVVAAPIGVWTGTQSNGQVANNTCNNFQSQSSGQNGLMGELDQTTKDWTQAGNENCNQQLHLYCFEQ